MFSRTKQLAARLNRSVVVFDLEHTGGRKETRGITEFAACIVRPDGKLQGYSSLVKPAPGVLFNSFVTEITGITPKMVAKAPSWREVAADAVLPHQEALWVGYNSRASDIPVLVEECSHHGLSFAWPQRHLDLMRVAPAKAPLSAQVEQYVLGVDTEGAHRAAKDALMTLWLLEALLPSLSDEAMAVAMQPESKVCRVLPPAPLRAVGEVALEWQTTSRQEAPSKSSQFLSRAFGGLRAALG